MKLEEIIKENGPVGQHVKPAAECSVLCDFRDDGMGEYNAELGVLELRDMYTEKYLLAYTANES